METPSSTNNFPFLASGGEMGERTRNYDWSTSPLGTPDQWPISLRTLLSMMLTSRFPMLIFWGLELITFYNDAFRPSLGDNGKHPISLGQRGEQSWAESWSVIGPMIYNIMAGGEAVWFEDQRLPLYRDGQMSYAYWTYSFSPLTDDVGSVNGVLVTCSETTKAVESLQQLNQTNDELRQSLEQNNALQKQTAESEAQFRTLIEEAPVATCLFVGRDMNVDLINQPMLTYWGKDISVLGKPLIEAIPELAGQPFLGILDDVFTTGKTYEARNALVELIVDDVLGTYYFDFTYKPIFNEQGQVYAIINVSIDVTQRVIARQQLEEAESGLRVAVELAQLGTWSIDVVTNELTYSDRMIDWFGYDPQQQAYNAVIPIIQADDQERVERAVAWALNPESGGIYNEIYTVIHPKTGQKRILHAQGKTVFDTAGKAIRLNGTAQDITIQRELQLALENEVNLRTEQLGTINEALAANNEELEETNKLLNRSNENLQKFAYVASHDLQEPLRKIQQFGDLLKMRYVNASEEELGYIERMQLAAHRMSTLIRDLLSFSRISSQQDISTHVSLNDVVSIVLTDLELVIAETSAVINVASLPTIWGDTTQLGQLFQNLISNALKFRRPNVAPLIQINICLIADTALPPSVKPTRAAKEYYRIDVVDNGIGFDEKYLDRIFQVFQRLHGKNEFSGTGIGLAICERVAANHGGAIVASSQPNQGATFSVYFPS